MVDLKNASHRVSIKLICKAKDKILLIKPIGKDTFNLIGGWVDRWESIEDSLIREFQEETWLERSPNFSPKLIHVEIKHFPLWGQFDAVVNIFFIIELEEPFNVELEKGIYEDSWRFTNHQLSNLDVSEHSNKELLLSIV